MPADICIFCCFGWLSPAAVHSADCWFDSGVKWRIYHHIFTQKLLSCCIETIANSALNHRCVVVLIDSEQMLHPLWTQFFSDKCSYKMVNTLPSDIFISSAISCNFNLRTAKRSLWSFLIFSRTTAEFGRPEHSASFVFVRLHLKSTCHLLTIVSDEAEPELYLSSHFFAWTVFFSIWKQSFINSRNSDFSIVLKICNSSFT